MSPAGNKKRLKLPASALAVAAAALVFAVLQSWGQSGSQNQTQPANSQSSQDIPDAPSTVQPPAPKPAIPAGSSSGSQALPRPTDRADRPEEGNSAPPPMPPVDTVPAGTFPEATSQGGTPRNQINPKDDLYKISVTTNFVQIPVMVKDSKGRRVDGLLPNDFTVLENGKPQKLTYFTSDPFQLSVAILLDLGMADVAVQKVHQTYASLVGAFSPYDEFALYTYSSTVSQVTDFTN